MTVARLVAAIFAMIITAAPAFAEVTDFLGVPGPIEFAGKSFELAWTARPSENYVKQEYVPPGQEVETYDRMLLVELVTGTVKVNDAVLAQIDMLKKRKATDPLVNMEVMQHDATGEVLLDFIVSSKDAKGEYTVEWNAYRYTPYADGSGKTGVLLFAVSRRAYGNQNAKAFLGALKQFRFEQIGALMKAALPAPR